ncbi:MAG: PEGA domain-containing protein [Kiritimatiellae bacterium]|nr:PEGA domain-containing protein [Kiritimatiellia bacterium]
MQFNKFLVAAVASTVSFSLTALPNAMEGVAYSAQLAEDGENVISWELLPGDYAESFQSSTFAETGEARGWRADDSCWMLDLPFDFPFYDTTYSRCYVADNGTIAFDGPFSRYWVSESEFLAHPMIAPLWADLYSRDMDIFVESNADYVSIRWVSEYWSGSSAVNVSATLFSNGKIIFSYGAGNIEGGFIGVSIGDGETQFVSTMSNCGAMDNANDIVFVPLTLPDGLLLAADGTVSGTCDDPGDYTFSVAATLVGGAVEERLVNLTVDENPALRPAITSATPEAGALNIAALGGAINFAVTTSHPSSGAVSIQWLVDGEPVGTGTAFPYKHADDALHTVKVVASATNLPKTAMREWKVGVLTLSDPASKTISTGMNTTLSVELTSSTPATITWFDAETDDEIGTGSSLALKGLSTTASYYAVAQSAIGVVTSAVATVTVDPKPTVGRIYKMTGPAFVGNRLVLRAKPYGDLTGATYAWKRGGVTVATTERLDIGALKASDFGAYTLTVTTSYGTATSDAYVLQPAPAGVPYGWGASGHGRTEAPEGLTGVAQIASGMNFNLGLTTNGTVTAWGYNGHGGCDVPDGLENVSFVAAGGYESHGAGFAVKTDGSVVAWGEPHKVYYDSYTNGWDTVNLMPADLADVVQIAVGGDFAVALRADGTVVTWGARGGWWDWDEDLQEDVWVPEDYYAVPLAVRDIVAIAAGDEHVVSLCADGTVLSWGKEYNDNGQYDVPEYLADAVAVGAMKSEWNCAGFAICADGQLAAWGNAWNGITDVPLSVLGFVSVDGGQEHAVALDAAGQVAVWGYTNTWNYSLGVVPAAVRMGALGVAAGGYHCTAILTDTDGDTIADNEERLLGRDPAVWEDTSRVDVSGRVSIDGADGAGAVVAFYDASGARRAKAEADEDGRYEISGLVPGLYFVKIEADGAVDAWLDEARPSFEAPAPFSTFAGDRDDANFDLKPGQAPAYARVIAHVLPEDADWWNDECEVASLPNGTQFYIDLWPVTPVGGGLIDLGEAPASHSAIYWETESHIISVKLPDDGQIPAPCDGDGIELDTIEANPHFSVNSGTVSIVTEPAGAEVWIDYADQSLGVTPLTVDNIAATAASHAHILLLKKDGYLRPRPIWFYVEADETTEISVELTPASEEGLSVAVSSAVEGLDIYLDYLPTGEVTPATIDGLDPASHAGYLWNSASHSIMLRRKGVAPILPRPVDESGIDPETGLPLDGKAIPLSINPEILIGYTPAAEPILITFDAVGNARPGAVVSGVPADGGYDELPTETPTCNGYDFAGWALDDGIILKTLSDLPEGTTSVTLHAFWVEKGKLAVVHADDGPGAIQAAIDAVSDGGVVEVHPGTYSSFDATGREKIEIRAVFDPDSDDPENTVATIDGGHKTRCATLGNDVVLSGLVLKNGKADFGGGALGGILMNCDILDCVAVMDENGNGGDGGGTWGSILSRCIVSRCAADGNGGGLAEGEAENCLVVDCEAGGFGGGAYHATLTGCTVYGCAATTGAGVAGCTVRNSIVWENRLYATDKKGVPLLGNCANVTAGKKTLYKNACTYTDSSPKPAGTGNLAKDPLFIDAESGDFRLQFASPVKNKGKASLAACALDLAGLPRAIGTAPDMGAYEIADGTPVPRDYDGDGVCDAAYFDATTATWVVMQSRDGLLVEEFGEAKATPVPADYDGDGRADFATYSATAKVPEFRILTQKGEEYGPVALGEKGATPFAADIDGDGIADPGVFQGNAKKPAFTILPSSSGSALSIVFGTKGATAVTGDFDGDGEADFGCYTATASKPAFSIALSKRGRNPSAPFNVILGAKGSTPCCGDFDGDGTTDFAAYSGTAASPQLYRMFSTSKWREIRTLPFGNKGSRAATGYWNVYTNGDREDAAIEFQGQWWSVDGNLNVGKIPAPGLPR